MSTTEVPARPPGNAAQAMRGVGHPGKADLPGAGRSPATVWMACGLFLLVLGIYALSSPGRIDIIDGEARFDVAYNWLVHGRPIITDSWIKSFTGVTGRDGFRYSYYGAPASVLAMPLVWLGLHFKIPPIQPAQFLFSLTSSILGAGIAPVLFLFYMELGVSRRKALTWTTVSSFATYIWPISNSAFDNAQHAFFTVAALYLGFVSSRRKSAKYAFAGGLLAGVLVLYQEYFLLIIPALALSTLTWDMEENATVAAAAKRKTILNRVVSAAKQSLQAASAMIRAAWKGPGEARSACLRYCLFVAAAGVGVLLSLVYNDVRFGSPLSNGKLHFVGHNYSILGNPLAGFLTLLVSPGKSILLYSPPILLGILGFGHLWRRKSELATAVATSSLIIVLFTSCLSFAGGDWCWGPRYLALLLPLWALAFPFMADLKLRRDLVLGMVAAGLLVQALGLSVENQRFFFDRGLNDFFWAEDSWFYFKHSALVARVGEVVSLNEGVPDTAQMFNPIPLSDWSTYCILGPPPSIPRNLAPIWMRHFKVFFLPRPWPLWMSWLPPALRPINVGAWMAGLLCMAGLGAGLIYRGLRQDE